MARRIGIVALILVPVLLVVYAVGSAFVWDKLTKVDGMCHPDWAENDPTHFSIHKPSVDSTPYLMPAPEDVTIPSRDAGIQISGWWIAAEDPGAPAVVVVHGHTACKRDPDVLLPAGMLHRAGFSVLLIDLRDHGDSTDEDGRFAGGTEEFRDVLGAWDWLQATKSISVERIGLLGVSLGAATVLIASGEEPRVVATWEDSSYADISVAIKAELRRNGYPEFLEFGGVAMAQWISGDDLHSRSPLMAVQRMGGRKLFITHGTEDQRLSVQYGYDLIAAAQAADVDVRAWIVPGASHTGAMRLDREEYERRLVEFFRGALASTASRRRGPVHRRTVGPAAPTCANRSSRSFPRSSPCMAARPRRSRRPRRESL
jgi:dipeptidyl aminopeptidase/acylaminoacyl peptidase